MTDSDLVIQAAELSGGIVALARAMNWDQGSLAAVKSGRIKLPPFRAVQITRIIGGDEDVAIFRALRNQAQTPLERSYWSERLVKAAEDAHEKPSTAALSDMEISVHLAVRETVGEPYDFVCSPAIERYLYKIGREKITERQLNQLAKRAQLLYDQHKDFFQGRFKTPINARRELMAQYLAGEQVDAMIEELKK